MTELVKRNHLLNLIYIFFKKMYNYEIIAMLMIIILNSSFIIITYSNNLFVIVYYIYIIVSIKIIKMLLIDIH